MDISQWRQDSGSWKNEGKSLVQTASQGGYIISKTTLPSDQFHLTVQCAAIAETTLIVDISANASVHITAKKLTWHFSTLEEEFMREFPLAINPHTPLRLEIICLGDQLEIGLNNARIYQCRISSFNTTEISPALRCNTPLTLHRLSF
jgi:hypothetical protein